MIIIEGKNKHLTKRYVANVIDYLIVFILIGVCVFLLGEPNSKGGYTLTGFPALIIPFIWLVYFPLCECLTGQTLAKKALNLYVVDSNGNSPMIGQAFIRRSMDFVELTCLGIPSLLAINHSKSSQRIGDMMAQTLVVCSETVCAFCGTTLELTIKEAVKKTFHCPNCQRLNDFNTNPVLL